MDRRKNFLTACRFEEPEWIPTDCTSHAGMMNKEFDKIARYFGIDDPVYEENLVGMINTFDERIFGKFPIDVRTIWPGVPDKFEKKFIDEKTYQVSECGFILRMTDMYHEFYDFPLKDDTAETVKMSKWWPDPFDPGRTRGLRERVKALYDDTDFVIKAGIPINGLMEVSQRMRGLERFFIDLYEEEEFVNALLDKLLEVQMDLYTVYLEAIGDLIQVIEYADDFGMQTGLQISENMYEKYFKKRHQKIWSHIHNLTDAKIYLHSCGSISDLLPHWIEDGVDIIESIQPRARNMEPAELKKKFGGKIIFWGGLDVQGILPYGTPEEVDIEVKRLMEIYAPGGGYVFSPAHAVQYDVPVENWIAMWDAVEKYGKYPISL